MSTLRQKKLTKINVPFDLRYKQVIGIVYLVSVIIGLLCLFIRIKGGL